MIGTIVTYIPDKGKPYDVYIEDGQFLGGNGGVSNFWSWRRVLKNADGSIRLGYLKSGYGNFIEPKKKYKIEIKITEE